MELRTILLVQTLMITFFMVSIYFILLRVEEIEKRKFLDSLDDFNRDFYDYEDNTEEKGIIRNQYIVVLHENATFIDEFTKTNWIKNAIDNENGSYSKIIHYYSMPKYAGWKTPSESMKLLNKNYQNNNGEKIEIFKGFAAKLSPDMYEYFVKHPSVKFVESDEYVQIDDKFEKSEELAAEISREDKDSNLGKTSEQEVETSSVVYKTKSSLNLSRLINRDPITDINKSYYKFGYESAYDVYVYVIDTGVNVQHTSFLDRLGYDTENKNRVTLGKNFLESEGIDDKNGHGTHVAGIIGSTTWGVAKRVNIVSVKVMNQNGSGKWSDILAAIEWCQNHLYTQTNSIKGIINISLSGAIKVAANNAIKASISQGMHFSVAAGNNGKDACEFSPASASQYGAVVVGSINSDDVYSKFSNYGKCITVYAPGYKIISASNLDNTSFREMSGTSMAAPHVAGVMALMLSYKNMTPKELYDLILSEASTGYIKNLDEESPNLIAYIPKYAIASRCNPLDPNDCLKTTEQMDAEMENDTYFINNFKSRKEKLNNDYIVLQN